MNPFDGNVTYIFDVQIVAEVKRLGVSADVLRRLIDDRIMDVLIGRTQDWTISSRIRESHVTSSKAATND